MTAITSQLQREHTRPSPLLHPRRPYTPPPSHRLPAAASLSAKHSSHPPSHTSPAATALARPAPPSTACLSVKTCPYGSRLLPQIPRPRSPEMSSTTAS